MSVIRQGNRAADRIEPANADIGRGELARTSFSGKNSERTVHEGRFIVLDSKNRLLNPMNEVH
jgi:hypothetical protein